MRIATSAGDGERGARLCAADAATGAAIGCFQARTPARTFRDNPKAEMVAFSGTRDAVLFTARDNKGGSGSSNFWALLVFGADGKWRDLLPEITVSEQSDHGYWSSPTLSHWGIFSTADYAAGKGEMHFGRHRYTIRSFEFCEAQSRYVLADSFLTKATFPGLDEADAIHVVRPSMREIEARLLSRPAHCTK